MKKELKIILLTALLEIVSLGIILPILPFVIRSFGYGDQWVGITFAMASVGLFFGGMIFGRLSDRYGRKRILSYTVILNVIGYSLFAFSPNILIFILSRTIAGFAGAGLGVAQAYISDISKPDEKAKNMGYIGAAYGIGFILGPAFGSLFSGHSLQFLGIISASILMINALLVWFILPESKRCIECADKEESFNPIDFPENNRQLLALFITSFGVALGFSGNQSALPMFLYDNFGIDEKHMGYVFAFIGVISVIYQTIFLKYVRNRIKERGLVIFGIFLMALSFTVFALNKDIIIAFICIMAFPIAYGSINPGIGALIAKYAGNETGKAMGTNVSYMSIANIFGPIVAGFAYSEYHSAPYLLSAIFFLLTAMLVIKYIRR